MPRSPQDSRGVAADERGDEARDDPASFEGDTLAPRHHGQVFRHLLGRVEDGHGAVGCVVGQVPGSERLVEVHNHQLGSGFTPMRRSLRISIGWLSLSDFLVTVEPSGHLIR